ncbi:MAG: MaoC family dehydratase N-terminal domain-containing protein [Acidobacteriota bacterium]
MKLSDWIGRTESCADTVTVAPLAALSATLDRNDPRPVPGDRVPLLWHWLYCLPTHKQSELGADGHARLGEFLPPVPLTRRMYAGGRVEVRHPLRVGDAIERVSRIEDVREKEGRSGPLVFVKVRHHITGPDGLALIEDHDIVYAGSEKAPATSPDPQRASDSSRQSAADSTGRQKAAALAGGGTPQSAGLDAPWTREIRPDDVLLFRYSALTFNGYRIHYDRRFATEVQGYPGLVVHAPLVATLLADLLRRNLGETNVSAFSFRAIRPLFDGDPFFVCGRPSHDGTSAALWAQDSRGVVTFEATAVLF